MIATVRTARRGAPVLAAGLVVLVAVAGCGVVGGGSGGDYDAQRDVSLVGCGPGDIGSVEADVRITNRDDRQRSYFITARATNADGDDVATLHGAATAVRAGQTVTVETVGLGFDAPASPECELVTVDSVAD